VRRWAAATALAVAVTLSGPALPADAAARRAAAPLGAGTLALAPGPDAGRDPGTGAVRVAAQPGGGVWQSAVVTNRSAARVTVVLGADDDPAVPGSGSWVQPTTATLLLDPGASEVVRFTVAPSGDAAPGEVRTRLHAEVADHPGTRRDLEVVVAVLEGGAAPAPRDTDAARGGESVRGTGTIRVGDSADPTFADRFLMVAVLAAFAMVVLAAVLPPGIRRRRDRRRARTRARTRARAERRASPPPKEDRSQPGRDRAEVYALDVTALNAALREIPEPSHRR
jgi:hypothetical protein